MPTYADTVSKLIKNTSQQTSLSDMAKVVFVAGGMPIHPTKFSLIIPNTVPEPFTKTLGEETSKTVYSYWLSFLQIHQEVETVLAVISNQEKQWLRNNANQFFFGAHPKDDEYDFFTTDSTLPLKFFEMASRVDLVKLAECARRLSGIVDDIYNHWPDFAVVILKEDFIWEERGIKLLISGRDHVTHTTNADFFIDLGGNNTFHTNAGGTEGVRAAALHIDFFGNNVYSGDSFVQGSGFLGIGILASFSGHNTYKAAAYSEGCGFFGVGLLMNLRGHNHYELNFGGQSFALFGSSLLWNKGGNNTYVAHEGMAQAASSTLGVAFLVDSEGANTYLSGVSGKVGTRDGGMGQGASVGVRHDPWIENPSFYGGLSFLYNGGPYNTFKTAWLGQGSAYFLGAGIVVAEGSNNSFHADYDSQGQGLHLAAGLLFQKGGYSRFEGGWGSLGVGADRSVGMFINTGGNNVYKGTEQSVGTARKPKGLGVFIDTQGDNTYAFQKLSNTNIQKPSSPNAWPAALFLELGKNNLYPEHVDDLKRGANLRWGIDDHGIGIDTDVSSDDLFAKFPAHPRVPFPFNPVDGWASNTSFKPLKRAKTKDEVQALVKEILHADYDHRRHLYESIDLIRFSHPGFEVDLSDLLSHPAEIPEDQFNYAALWAIQNDKKAHLNEVIDALNRDLFSSDYARRMAIQLVGELGTSSVDPLLAKIMLTDHSQENRYAAALELAERATPPSLPLLQLGLKSESERVRYAIAKGLQDSPTPHVLELITPLFNDPSFYVRRSAALTAISLHNKKGDPSALRDSSI